MIQPLLIKALWLWEILLDDLQNVFNNLFVKELLKFNDMKAGQKVEMGDIIYLQAKKKQTAKGLDKYIADQDGESLWQISQRYGVKLQDLCKRNSLSKDYVLREGDTILLR